MHLKKFWKKKLKKKKPWKKKQFFFNNKKHRLKKNCFFSNTTCDRQMLRYMADVSLLDSVPSAVVAERCWVSQVLDVVRSRRLHWFGHVERREEGDPLAVIREWEVEGRCPHGRPRKTWQRTVEEDLQSLHIDKAQALCSEQWKKIIARLTP